jgi:hypothetical protein
MATEKQLEKARKTGVKAGKKAAEEGIRLAKAKAAGKRATTVVRIKKEK